MACDAAQKWGWLWREACQANSMAADKTWEKGLAMFCPAMSGAEPWAAWPMAWWAPAFKEPPKPKLPDNSAVRSDKMSPNILVVTMTSNFSGARTTCAIMASTMKSSTATSGKSWPTSAQACKNKPSVMRSTLALCTKVSRFWRKRANSNALRAMRSQHTRVMRRIEMATSSVTKISLCPMAMLRSA